jgi:16S rRNA (uracil1498-N3)-methyltransferase
MARRRFFVSEIRRGTAELTGQDAEHLVRVLRVEVGQKFEISDNRKIYLAEVGTARKSLVSFNILEEISGGAQSVRITLFAALFKFDRFEWLIEKATELGASTIQPFEAERSERGLVQASVKRLSRWQKIALEASQQSRRVHLPEVEQTISLAKLLPQKATVQLFLDEDAKAPPILRQLPSDRSPEDHVALLLGPEGGWTDAERTNVMDHGWVPCSLGQTILRAETAAVAGLAVVQAAWAGTTVA